MEFKSFLLYSGCACLNSMDRYTKSVQAQCNLKKNKLKRQKEKGGGVEREEKEKKKLREGKQIQSIIKTLNSMGNFPHFAESWV